VTDLQPRAVHTGSTETVTGTGTLDEAVTSAKFTATVSALGAQLTSCSGDGTTDIVCNLPMGVGKITVKALSFPLAAGAVNIPVEIKTSSLIPASLANVDVHIAATEQNGESVVCLDVHTSKAVSSEEVPLTMSWADWKDHFGMVFNGEDDTARQSVFEANVAFIESENAKDNTFTLGVNHFSHLSEDEFIAQFTGGADGGSVIGSDDAHMGQLEIGARASSVDWTTQAGVVNPVKDQGQCGSCWAFSAVGTVESGYALAAGKLGSYSEQQLVDCDTSRSQGCSGGFNQYGIQYIGQTGSCSESAYPYKAADGTCTASSCSKSLSAGTVTGYNSVTGSNAGLESALNQQPVSVTMKADNTWQSYRSGVVSENCGFLARPNHAIIAVGYDGDNFKIRNSWGASWGEGGYIRVAKSTSNPFCIWSTTPFVPTISADVTV